MWVTGVQTCALPICGGLGKMMRALGQFGRGGFPGMGSFGR